MSEPKLSLTALQLNNIVIAMVEATLLTINNRMPCTCKTKGKRVKKQFDTKTGNIIGSPCPQHFMEGLANEAMTTTDWNIGGKLMAAKPELLEKAISPLQLEEIMKAKNKCSDPDGKMGDNCPTCFGKAFLCPVKKLAAV